MTDTEKERKRLLDEFERTRHWILCTSTEHIDPMCVQAATFCSECGAAACNAHVVEHDDDCAKRRT